VTAVRITSILWLFLSSVAIHASTTEAPDALAPGPYEVATGEYHYPEEYDREILPVKDPDGPFEHSVDARMTEVWARAYWPARIASLAGSIPVIILLHGNHTTCGTGSNPRVDLSSEYTTTGKCPPGFVVAPSHEGYGYLANMLASWGYFVVAPNVNRGINQGAGYEKDPALIQARGRMVLKHLRLLMKWSATGGVPSQLGLASDALVGRLDFQNVGFFGHSRGGEGVRAAYAFLKKRGMPVTVRGIFEIGATDFGEPQAFDAVGTAWSQLVPMCDGDVFDFAGVKPFYRMTSKKDLEDNTPKSVYYVYGTNHNYFNTEWQEVEWGLESWWKNEPTAQSPCWNHSPLFEKGKVGSERQRMTAVNAVTAFFRSVLGQASNPQLFRNFNPMYGVPALVSGITEVLRVFSPGLGHQEYQSLDDLKTPRSLASVGVEVSYGSEGLPADLDLPMLMGMPYTLSAQWTKRGSYFDLTWADSVKERDLSGFKTLDLLGARKSTSDTSPDRIAFSIALLGPSGETSGAMGSDEFAVISLPGDDVVLTYQSMRIPLIRFAGADLKRIAGVRMVFDKTDQGAIRLAQPRFHRSLGLGAAIDSGSGASVSSETLSQMPSSAVQAGNRARRQMTFAPRSELQTLIRAQGDGSGRKEVDFLVRVKEGSLPIGASAPILWVGSQEFKISVPIPGQDRYGLIYRMTEKEFNTLEDGAEVVLKYGRAAQKLEFRVGRFSKSAAKESEARINLQGGAGGCGCVKSNRQTANASILGLFFLPVAGLSRHRFFRVLRNLMSRKD
jgi:hypothetical protein